MGLEGGNGYVCVGFGTRPCDSVGYGVRARTGKETRKHPGIVI